MIVEAQQLVVRYVAKDSRPDVADEVRVTLAAAVVIDDHFQEVGLARQIVVAARGAEDRVERIDVLDVEADLEVPAHGLDRGLHLREHLVFAFVKEAVPQDDFRIFYQRSPELDEVAIAGPFARQRALHKPIEFRIALARAFEVDAALPCSLLMKLTETRHAGRGDALRVARAERIQQWAVALIKEQDAIDFIRLAEIGGQSRPKRAHRRMEQTECAGSASLQIHLGHLLHPTVSIEPVQQ